MTIPAENLAVAQIISAIGIHMMCFPSSTLLSASICPYELFITSGMSMTRRKKKSQVQGKQPDRVNERPGVPSARDCP